MATKPSCVKCGATTFTEAPATHGGVAGFYVYCGTCGAVVTWVRK